MAAVPSLAPGGPRSEPRSAARVWTSGNPGAIGAFRVHLSLVNRRRGRQKGGHRNECPHAGVRVAGD